MDIEGAAAALAAEEFALPRGNRTYRGKKEFRDRSCHHPSRRPADDALITTALRYHASEGLFLTGECAAAKARPTAQNLEYRLSSLLHETSPAATTKISST